MTGVRLLLAISAIGLMAAAPSGTVGPPVTGSMYNGNNVHPPKLPEANRQAEAAQASKRDESSTGAHIQGGHTASEGGGG